jgi:hypothetical protein
MNEQLINKELYFLGQAYNAVWSAESQPMFLRNKPPISSGLKSKANKEPAHPQSSSMLWNYTKCGVYIVESEAGC